MNMLFYIYVYIVLINAASGEWLTEDGGNWLTEDGGKWLTE